MQPRGPEPAAALILACGALVRELRSVLTGVIPEARDRLHVGYLPAPLHNRPEQIVPSIRAELERHDRRGDRFERILLGYGDCGTGGALDRFVDEWNRSRPTQPMARLRGDHCYGFFAGVEEFAELHNREIGTFFLTDFMVVNFDALIWQGLGLDSCPELGELYFGNYTRALYLAQAPSPDRIAAAGAAAERLGLRFEHLTTGLGPFATQIHSLLGVR